MKKSYHPAVYVERLTGRGQRLSQKERTDYWIGKSWLPARWINEALTACMAKCSVAQTANFGKEYSLAPTLRQYGVLYSVGKRDRLWIDLHVRGCGSKKICIEQLTTKIFSADEIRRGISTDHR
jgi:hypothetical protein